MGLSFPHRYCCTAITINYSLSFYKTLYYWRDKIKRHISLQWWFVLKLTCLQSAACIVRLYYACITRRRADYSLFPPSWQFVQTELCDDDSSSDEKQIVCFSSEKSQRFHQTDKQITSVELWMTWHANEGTVWEFILVNPFFLVTFPHRRAISPFSQTIIL